MCRHEEKNCPRCGQAFECKAGTIMQCQCYGVLLTGWQRARMEGQYADCLCRDCLLAIQREAAGGPEGMGDAEK